jgi:hypothetical protein
VSDRERELAARHTELRLRVAAQRRSVGAQVDSFMARFGSVDRLASRARNAILQPRVIIAAIVAIVALRRLRGVNSVGRLLLLMAAARRLWRIVKVI